MIITIDGKQCSCENGEFLLQVARRNGIYIPTLCHHEALPGQGCCRVCIVEVDEGLMAVLCPAGENSIDFVYQPDGIRLSRALTLGGIVVWLAYTAYFVWRKRRTKRA